MYEVIKDIVIGAFKLFKMVLSPVVGIFANIFRKTTSIVGPSKAGKTTLQKILRGKPYFIGEYNHTDAIITVKKKKVVTYKVDDKATENIKLKIKRDLPGENFEAWKQVLRMDRPKGIILIVDLVGLVDSSGLRVNSTEEFIDFHADTPEGEHIEVRTTPKEKFEQHILSFRTIQEACVENNVKVKGLIVFLNKCDIWLKRGIDLEEIIYFYKKEISKHINLTSFAKDLQLERDVCWEATSMVQEQHKMRLEPALLRFASIYKK